jgi:hypothetical protein
MKHDIAMSNWSSLVYPNVRRRYYSIRKVFQQHSVLYKIYKATQRPAFDFSDYYYAYINPHESIGIEIAYDQADDDYVIEVLKLRAVQVIKTIQEARFKQDPHMHLEKLCNMLAYMYAANVQFTRDKMQVVI